MNEANALQDLLHDWTLPVPLTCSIVLTAALYFVGWVRIRRTRPSQFPLWRLACFEGGMALLWGSIASPMDELADALLSAHMMEHLLLMSAVPPLVLLGSHAARTAPVGIVHRSSTDTHTLVAQRIQFFAKACSCMAAHELHLHGLAYTRRVRSGARKRNMA
jgi:cytochrome c oxidase assembly factor CtaG